MSSKRLFWMGLGTGMMAGALLLQLMNVGQARSTAWEEMDRTSGETDSRQEAVYTQEEAQELVNAAVEKAGKEMKAQAEAATPMPKKSAAEASSTSPVPSPSVKPSNSPAGTPSAAPTPSRSQIIRILPNSNLSTVARLLQDKGVLKDADAFVAYMKQGKSSGTVRAGYFSFNDSLEMEEIKKIVTGQPMDPAEAKKKLKEAG